MKYEKTNRKLDEYIDALEHIKKLREKYLADWEKVTKRLSIYNSEYQKTHGGQERESLNAQYVTAMVTASQDAAKLNTEIEEIFRNETKPIADTAMATMLAMEYIAKSASIGKNALNREYFEQITTPLFEARDFRGLQELCLMFGTVTKDWDSIPYYGMAQHELVEQDELSGKLRNLCEGVRKALPRPEVDAAAEALADTLNHYGQVSHLIDYAKQIKADITGVPYTAQAQPFGPMNFRTVR